MGRVDEDDLDSMKIIFRKLLNKHRIGGVHVEITQLNKWGLTKRALKYCVNHGLLNGKKSDGNMEYAINSHKLKEISRILNEVDNVSQL